MAAAAGVSGGEGGKHFKTDGKKNDDYLAYGKDVLAMADGTVKTLSTKWLKADVTPPQ